MANTYVKIASVTVGSGGAASMDFTSIPGTYDDLLIKISARNTGNFGASNSGARFSFNGSNANMTFRQLYGTGSAAASNSGTGGPFGCINDGGTTASTFGSFDLYIPNYAGSTNKSVSGDSVEENNATAAFASLVAGLWSQTAAITSITIGINQGSYAQHSSATLYGIKKS
jgi:hypothetical protein